MTTPIDKAMQAIDRATARADAAEAEDRAEKDAKAMIRNAQRANDRAEAEWTSEDAAENIVDNPKSWAAWKREAERLSDALAAETTAREEADGKAVAGWRKFHDMREAWEHEKARTEAAEVQRLRDGITALADRAKRWEDQRAAHNGHPAIEPVTHRDLRKIVAPQVQDEPDVAMHESSVQRPVVFRTHLTGCRLAADHPGDCPEACLSCGEPLSGPSSAWGCVNPERHNAVQDKPEAEVKPENSWDAAQAGHKATADRWDPETLTLQDKPEAGEV